MRARFFLGRAGSGKTFLCLEEARRALKADPEGAPLIFLAPKQATFQLERQLLGDAELGGFTRLRIHSFERLAQFILEQLPQKTETMLSEQGRTMALRALLMRRRRDLRIFRSGEGLARFATTLSDELREWQRREFTPAGLLRMSEREELSGPLRYKLHDLGLLLGDYLDWLKVHGAQDPDCLLDLAVDALEKAPEDACRIDALWMDGFAEMSAQELSLLTAVARRCRDVTLAFCLDPASVKASSSSWLSIWSGIEQTRQECWTRLGKIAGAELREEIIDGRKHGGRFTENAALRHLEEHWTLPQAFREEGMDGRAGSAVQLTMCPTPEMEAVFAAREILRLVRDGGGRYRDAAVLVRKMDAYAEHLRRVFARYEIPFFLDRRESASHHPLAELTRSALRAAAFDWGHDDWFAALKTGLVWGDADAIDRVENEALRRGWKGETWFRPLPGEGETIASVERLRKKWIAPFAALREALGVGTLFRPSGEEVAKAIRELWRALKVEAQLEKWKAEETIHATVWEALNALLDDLARAFGKDVLPLRDWLAIIEAGLTGLTVGVIPPALDQVLIGAIDRSRNPELKLAIILGCNETVFPAPPRLDSLLSESDRDELRATGAPAGPTRWQLLGREQFLAYIACTRSRERLAMTWAEHEATDAPLNPSTFVAHLRKLFPALETQTFTGPEWSAAEHASELMDRIAAGQLPARLKGLLTRPEFALLREQMRLAGGPGAGDIADLTDRLYGRVLKTSVSRLEDFAACAFKFFTRSGLRAEERQKFELDVRERGSFQHEALKTFRNQLQAEGKRWRDITPEEGRARMKRCVDALSAEFRDGLLASNPQARFAARTMAETLGDFVAASIEWMWQYEFDPRAVELAFGREASALPGWEIDLGEERKLIFRGVIDRVDVWPIPGSDAALAVVMDYKSGAKKLDDTLMKHGLQLQLPGYLALLRHIAAPPGMFGVDKLIPAGMFYVNLRGKTEPAATRGDALRNRDEVKQAGFKHFGRFDFSQVRRLDKSGGSGQFNYKINQNGEPNKTIKDAMASGDFLELLDDVEEQLRRMGREIYGGAIDPNPYQKGEDRACDKCECQGVCRFDPWTGTFRRLK